LVLDPHDLHQTEVVEHVEVGVLRDDGQVVGEGDGRDSEVADTDPATGLVHEDPKPGPVRRGHRQPSLTASLAASTRPLDTAASRAA
jgi:hypothetical protein